MERRGGGNMRKLFPLILVIIITFSGCMPNQGKRPFDYPPAKWVSKSPDVWFIVNSPEKDSEYFKPQGYLNLNGESINIVANFDYNVSVYFHRKDHVDDPVLFGGTCEFFSDKMVIKVDKKNDNLFKGKYDKITFIRTPLK